MYSSKTYIDQSHGATSHSIQLVVDLDFPPRSPSLPLTGGLDTMVQCPQRKCVLFPNIYQGNLSLHAAAAHPRPSPGAWHKEKRDNQRKTAKLNICKKEICES